MLPGMQALTTWIYKFKFNLITYVLRHGIDSKTVKSMRFVFAAMALLAILGLATCKRQSPWAHSKVRNPPRNKVQSRSNTAAAAELRRKEKDEKRRGKVYKNKDKGKPLEEPFTKPFPARWGELPQRQSRDHVVFPGGYGSGSSSIRRWIKAKMLADKNNGVVDGEDGTVEAGRRQQIKEASKEPASNAASSPIDNGDDRRTKEAVWDATRNPQFETTVCTIDKIPSQGMTKSLFESKYEGGCHSLCANGLSRNVQQLCFRLQHASWR